MQLLILGSFQHSSLTCMLSSQIRSFKKKVKMDQKVEDYPWDNRSDYKDKKITGFHGFTRDYVHSLGPNYFAPSTNSTPLIPAKKLEAKGGDAGAVWDDGVHQGVKNVYVGQGQDGIAFVKFEYQKGSQKVIGDEHGKRTLLGIDEFEIDVDDYIVYVEGSHEQVITSLRFKTYKGKTSQLFGINSGTKFVLQGGKILGFHGHATNVLNSLGAYVVFSATSLSGKWIKMEQKGDGPGLRCSHGIAMVGNKIYTFGGELIPNQPIDKHLYVFDIKTQTWSIAPATGDIPKLACIGVKMVSIGTTLYTFGGGIVTGEHNGFYSFDTVKNEWKLLTHVDEGPAARCFHSMAADDKNVYVFGGVSNSGRVKTLDAYNIVDKKWVQCETPGDLLCARGGSGLEVVNGKVWVMYGFNGCNEMDDVHYYDLCENKWTQVETSGEKPSPRSVFASAAFGKYVIVFGGEIAVNSKAHVGPGDLIDGTFALDTETLKWERLDKFEEESPSARGWSASMAATINGKKGLVMLGGKAPSNDRFDELFFFA